MSKTSNPISGATFLFAAKAIFVLSSYVTYSFLPRLLSQEEVGLYLVINSIVSIINAVFITGTIQAISKFVSEDSARGGLVLKAATRLQLFLAGGVVATYFFVAPAIASTLNDPSLAPYLRLSAVIPFCYAFYAMRIGYLNGCRRFIPQSVFDIGFSFLKVSMVLSAAWMGWGAFGAIGGFSLASLTIFLLSTALVRPKANESSASPISATKILKFEATVLFYQGFMNLLMQIDLLLLKALSPAASANVLAAQYGSAVKLAQIAPSILVALNFLIFPLISKSISEGNPTDTVNYIQRGLRACLIIVAGPSAILAATSSETMALVFSSSYAGGGPSLAILTIGYLMLSILVMSLTIINSAGKPLFSLGTVAFVVLVEVLINYFLISSLGMTGAAVGASIAFGVGLVIAALYIRNRFGAFIPLYSGLRIGLSAGILYILAIVIPGQGVFLLAKDALLGLIYVFFLFLFRELRYERHQSLKIAFNTQ